jgi:hypothetical protein
MIVCGGHPLGGYCGVGVAARQRTKILFCGQWMGVVVAVVVVGVVVGEKLNMKKARGQ